MSRDAEWFSRPGRLFIRNVSIDAPPLNPNTPVPADDLVSAEGACPGMAAPGGPSDANALTNGPAGAPAPSQGRLGGARPYRMRRRARHRRARQRQPLEQSARRAEAVVTWLRGSRAGIYTFNAGRLSTVERAPEPAAPPRAAKPKAKKKAAT